MRLRHCSLFRLRGWGVLPPHLHAAKRKRLLHAHMSRHFRCCWLDAFACSAADHHAMHDHCKTCLELMSAAHPHLQEKGRRLSEQLDQPWLQLLEKLQQQELPWEQQLGVAAAACPSPSLQYEKHSSHANLTDCLHTPHPMWRLRKRKIGFISALIKRLAKWQNAMKEPQNLGIQALCSLLECHWRSKAFRADMQDEHRTHSSRQGGPLLHCCPAAAI